MTRRAARNLRPRFRSRRRSRRPRRLCQSRLRGGPRRPSHPPAPLSARPSRPSAGAGARPWAPQAWTAWTANPRPRLRPTSAPCEPSRAGERRSSTRSPHPSPAVARRHPPTPPARRESYLPASRERHPPRTRARPGSASDERRTPPRPWTALARTRPCAAPRRARRWQPRACWPKTPCAAHPCGRGRGRS